MSTPSAEAYNQAFIENCESNPEYGEFRMQLHKRATEIQRELDAALADNQITGKGNFKMHEWNGRGALSVKCELCGCGATSLEANGPCKGAP